MKHILLYLVSTIFLIGSIIPHNHLVTDAWLQQHKNDSNIIIIDARRASVFKKSHIAHAINIPFEKWFKGRIGNITHMYDTPKQVEALLDTAGVTPKSIIVFYSAGIKKRDYCDAVAGLWNAWLYGFKRSVVLNGGFKGWTVHGGQVVTKAFIPKRTNFYITKFNHNILASLPDVLEAIYNHDNIQLLDVRNSAYFLGQDTDRLLARHGRIPTAKLSSSALEVKKIDGYYMFISKKKSKAILSNSGYGVNLKKPIITYCNTGHNARGMWFVLKFLDNIKNVKVYDGSMLEYSRTLLPIKKGESFSNMI